MVFQFDPCGIICVLVTYAIVFYSDYVVICHLLRPVLGSSFSAIVNMIGFNLIAFLLVFSHLCAVFGDPGVVPLKSHPLDASNPSEKPAGWTSCSRCSIHRPPRAYHCRVCKRCVLRMDHHCPWINNCVGEFNQKYFILFLFYVGILCIYAIILVIFCRAVAPSKMETADTGTSVAVIHTIVLIAICCVFGLFIMAILIDQYKSIVEDETAVELLKNRATRRLPDDPESGKIIGRRSLSRYALLREVFGPSPVYLWPFPCQHLFRGRECDRFYPSRRTLSQVSLNATDPHYVSIMNRMGPTKGVDNTALSVISTESGSSSSSDSAV